METIIYSSPKKYVIVDIKNLLNENNIPVSSIQLYIKVSVDRHTKYGEFLAWTDIQNMVNFQTQEKNAAN